MSKSRRTTAVYEGHQECYGESGLMYRCNRVGAVVKQVERAAIGVLVINVCAEFLSHVHRVSSCALMTLCVSAGKVKPWKWISSSDSWD
jgi:hypothetical protein